MFNSAKKEQKPRKSWLYEMSVDLTFRDEMIILPELINLTKIVEGSELPNNLLSNFLTENEDYKYIYPRVSDKEVVIKHIWSEISSDEIGIQFDMSLSHRVKVRADTLEQAEVKAHQAYQNDSDIYHTVEKLKLLDKVIIERINFIEKTETPIYPDEKDY